MSLQDQLQQTLGTSTIIEHELDGGGMSRVFVATDTTLGRRVVVKVLPSEMSGPMAVERFKLEISIAARLQHAHMVPLLHAAGAPMRYSMSEQRAAAASSSPVRPAPIARGRNCRDGRGASCAAPIGKRYSLIARMGSRTASALFSSALRSSAVSSTSMTCSRPFLPSLHGTPR